MKHEKKKHEEKPEIEKEILEFEEQEAKADEVQKDIDNTVSIEIHQEVVKKLDERSKQVEEATDKFQRLAAEFDNYKKRNQRERESLCSDSMADVVEVFLPVLDNLERAVSVVVNDAEAKSLKDGIELVIKQIKDVMKGLNVEDIKTVGEAFDPNLHNAVMHIDDENYGENTIVEEFQKGYILKEKVIRHSMVKVAN